MCGRSLLHVMEAPIVVFDVRSRISIRKIFYNFHMIAMPHFGCHPADLQVKMLVTLFGALCVSWADKLIRVATDGEGTNTQRKTLLVYLGIHVWRWGIFWGLFTS